ncbi:hypothetical protein ABOM_004115 [Aspergillus bombycis]|uniref:Uncharacterized protein n=1 Tax=Aspergillus bombycis TaxID=109264 RepID=A0A1F8ACV1_9EURO|nr:hypothetical protein ABOM_004115 [Aspergillus bombycis]OGM49229.1 hypothetical protein ABOM_004115 [Aspergillus bombycis]
MDGSSGLSAGSSAYVPRLDMDPPTSSTNVDSPCSRLLLLGDADTLLYIDPPPQKPCASVLPRSPGSIPHRIHSQKLLDTGSDYFKDLFQPRAQARAISRRGLEGKLTNGIKYVIDITPPTVEDDAVIFLTELSCPLGIRNWDNTTTAWWDLAPARVGGEDQFEPPESKLESTSASIVTSSNAYGSKPDLPVEYSVARHHRGIEHIIYALEGFSPKLDTPCEFWTFFALARLFGVSTVPRISDIILSWFYDPKNARLIEYHPEIAYKIACGVQHDYLCRDSFSVLVGEEALLLLANSDQPPLQGRPQWTFHERFREPLLDDGELQRIEYASKSFLEYVIGRFIDLAGSEMKWLFELPSFLHLSKFTPETYWEEILMTELILTCKEYVRARIVQWLERQNGICLPPVIGSLGKDRSIHYKYVYSSMRYPERVLARTFWKNLMNEPFTGSHFPDIKESFWDSTIASLGNWVPAFRTHADAKIRPVTRSELCGMVGKFNSFVNHQIPNYQTQPGYPWDMEDDCDPETWLRGLQSNSKGPFKLDMFISDVQLYVAKHACEMFDLGRGSTERTDTVTCLTETELKYLPLWAGGNDDGTGGVFMDQDIPFLETGGFSAPGPDVHLSSAASTAGSISIISAKEIESTVQGASHGATDGYITEAMSIQSMAASSQRDKSGGSNHQEPASLEGHEAVDDCYFLLNSSADGDDNFSLDFDSDGDNTVVMDTT